MIPPIGRNGKSLDMAIVFSLVETLVKDFLLKDQPEKPSAEIVSLREV